MSTEPKSTASARAALIVALRVYSGSNAAAIMKALEDFIDAKIRDSK